MSTITWNAKPGDIVKAADGSGYEAEIVSLSKKRDEVVLKDVKTGRTYINSWFNLFVRYNPT